MSIENQIQEYTNSIKKSLDKTNKPIRRKFQAVLDKIGNVKRSSKTVALLAKKLEENTIVTSPVLDHKLPFDTYITFQYQNTVTPIIEAPVTEASTKTDAVSKIVVPDDLFLNLFDFDSNNEYERFQAALDSYLPVGIVLLPQKEDFFSRLVEQVLSLEATKKRDYIGNDFFANIVAYLDIELVNSDDLNDADKTKISDIWNDANIFHFNDATMRNVILGKSGLQLLHSDKFFKEVTKLSFHSNVNNKNQFFVIFHCPPIEAILKNNRIDLLEKTIEFVSQRLPNVFRLRSKYASEKDIDETKKLEIFKHLRLLHELPTYSIDPDLSCTDYLSELNRVRYQLEYQLLLKMETNYLTMMKWDNEYNEDTYLKYLSIRTLHTQYNVAEESIICSSIPSTELNDLYKDEYLDYTLMPDLLVNKEIAIEIETMRSVQNDRNVYLNFITTFVNKISSWSVEGLKNGIKEFWFVFSGFEVSRNYYQIKKSVQVISQKIEIILKRKIVFKVFAPDYYNRTIIPVDMESVYEPILEVQEKDYKKKTEVVSNTKGDELNFKDVIGLKEEKEVLLNLKKLQEDNNKLGIGGILFYGLPGCGKTYLSQAFAAEINRNFFCFSPAEIVSIWVGQSSKNIRSLFNQARAKSPALLFMDELDALGFSRDSISSGQAHTDQGATINQLLIELNNIDEDDVLVIGATNRVSNLDLALKRSGRFDLKIPIFPPDMEERKDMFNYYLSKVNKELEQKNRMPIDIDNLLLTDLGEESKGFTSSDIRTVCNLARIDALLKKTGYQNKDNVMGKIFKFIHEGMRTLRVKDVEHFIKECQENDSNSKKLSVLANEWLS